MENAYKGILSDNKQSVMLNWFQHLSLHNNKTLKQVQGDSLLRTGFTLVELLVVVLIIGILSSVALPQYTKAVEKSKAVEGEQMLRSLRDAQARCILENGETNRCWQNTETDNLFTNMDIEITMSSVEPERGACCGRQGKNFIYSLDGEYIYAERVQDGEVLYDFETTALKEDSVYYNQTVCFSGTKECKEVGYTVEKDGGWLKP